jgi:hypothetical protein
MASLPSIRLFHRVHRAEEIEAKLEAEQLPSLDLDSVSFSRAQQAARKLRSEDRARRATSVAPPPPRPRRTF